MADKPFPFKPKDVVYVAAMNKGVVSVTRTVIKSATPARIMLTDGVWPMGYRTSFKPNDHRLERLQATPEKAVEHLAGRLLDSRQARLDGVKEIEEEIQQCHQWLAQNKDSGDAEGDLSP